MNTFADGIDITHDLVARDYRTKVRSEISFSDVQVGVANGAVRGLEANLASFGIRPRDLLESERPGFDGSGLVQHHCAHHAKCSAGGARKQQKGAEIIRARRAAQQLLHKRCHFTVVLLQQRVAVGAVCGRIMSVRS